MTSLTILLVEDNEDDVFLLEQAFNKSANTSKLQAVCNGAEAVAYLKGEGDFGDRAKHPYPDILLLDLNMPRMNGFEVLEWVRHQSPRPGVVIYVLTASNRELDIQRAYELGANGYVVKPSRVDELIQFATTLHQWHHFVALPREISNRLTAKE